MTQDRLYRVEKLYQQGLSMNNLPGLYLNSPPCWREVYRLRARDARTAAVEAMFIIGSSRIRVIEVDECL